MKIYVASISFLFLTNAITANSPVKSVSGQISENTTYQHLIMYGQSLSVGAQSYPLLSVENVPGNYMLGEHIWINYWNSDKSRINPLLGKLAKQNSVGDTDLYPFTRAGTITAECPLYGVVNHLQKKIGGRFIATSCGTGGRSIEELSKESEVPGRRHYVSDFQNALTNAALAVQYDKSTISCPAIFFMQGENNYENKGSGLISGSKSTSDKVEYKMLLITLKNNMQKDIIATYGQTEKPVFITYQTGCQYGKIKELPIGMAQLEASNEEDDIICAGPVYPMPDRGGHLDPNGYRWYGEMMAKVYYRTQILGEEFKPLQPEKIMRTTNPKQIKIRFHVPVPPLVLDTWTTGAKFKDYGFEVYKDGIKQSLSKVETEGDWVVLTAQRDLSGGRLEIIYAGIGENTALTRGHGNLRDSDDYPAYFTYVDLDAKNSAGEYIYYREPGNSLRPVNEVCSRAGSTIYGQPYPLYNWSVAFYYTLSTDEQIYIIPGVSSGITRLEQIPQETKFIFTRDSSGLVFQTEHAEDVWIDIVDTVGRIIESTEFNGRHLTYPVQDLRSGAYIAIATVNGQSKCLKILR